MAKAFDSHIGSGINTSAIMPCDVQNGHMAQKGAPSHCGVSSFLVLWQIDITPHKCHISSLNCS